MDSTAGLRSLALLRKLVSKPAYSPDTHAVEPDSQGTSMQKWEAAVRCAMRPAGKDLAKTLLHFLRDRPGLKDAEVDTVLTILHRIIDACGGDVLALMVRGGLALSLQEERRDKEKSETSKKARRAADRAYEMIKAKNGESSPARSDDVPTSQPEGAAASGAGAAGGGDGDEAVASSDTHIPTIDMPVDAFDVAESKDDGADEYGPDGYGQDIGPSESGGAAEAGSSLGEADQVEHLRQMLLDRCIS